jgi:hypothetical protein
LTIPVVGVGAVELVLEFRAQLASPRASVLTSDSFAEFHSQVLDLSVKLLLDFSVASELGLVLGG